MARPRAADYEAQRHQLMQAAAELFAQRGFTAATMNDVAAAAGVSKATLYHYFQDKHALLGEIVGSHVSRLQALAREVMLPPTSANRDATAPLNSQCGAPAQGRPGRAGGSAADESRLRDLIRRFMLAYADAQNEHRVLTEDVKFLDEAARQTVLDGQREVVAAFARGIAACRPDLDPAMAKPLAMLLFGMINWTFTWLRPHGGLTHEALGEVVADLFFGGLGQVRADVPARHLPPAASDQVLAHAGP